MEILSPEFFSALLAIIIIDLVLAGDNAIVIALAARKLPPQLQMRAVVWGTAGAIAVRVAMTLIVVALLKVPGLMLVGGLLLLWIAYKLLAADDSGEHAGAADQITGFGSALRTIVIADAVMGLDNVLAVAGAAHGSPLLVVLGLLISIPIMVWGSTLVLKLVDRYPVVVYIGAGVLAWTAGSMIADEPLLAPYLGGRAWVSWVAIALAVGGVLLAGWLRNRGPAREGIVLPEEGNTRLDRPPGDRDRA